MQENAPLPFSYAVPRQQPYGWLLLAVRFGVVLGLWILYVTAFWGRFTGFWPAWVRSYTSFAPRAVWRACAPHLSGWSANYYLVWLGVTVVFGAVIPILAVRLMGRRGSEIGLGRPNRWGWRVILIAVLISLPFGFFIALEQPTVAEAARIGFSRPLYRKLIMLASTIPEHILLTGICVASFLPGFRLPNPPPLAPAEGTAARRALRWLGLAQPAGPDASAIRRFFAWTGLEPAALWGIVGGGLLFGIVHIGDRPVEFATSFPGGMAVCYVTCRSRSVWTGWAAHVSMMGFIQIMMLLLGRV